MRRILLLFNPASGRRHTERLHIIAAIEQTFRKRGLDVRSAPTSGPGSAGAQAAVACTEGVDIIFACGGDGTIHEVIQGMAFQRKTSLGIIPLGSANALARHLDLPLDPLRAALQQLNSPSQLVPLGKVTYQGPTGEASRYFIVMAGAGPDGALVYNMLGTNKHRFGRAMYYLRSAKLFLSHRFATFTVTTSTVSTRAVSAMAVRVADLGGLFSPLILGASIDDPQIHLTTIASPARLSLPAWFALSWARLHRHNPYVHTHHVDSFQCSAGEQHTVQVQADGEHLGQTPMTVTLIPNALRILSS